jgi:hypothetical protein
MGEPSDEFVTWQPARGVKTRLAAWGILIALAACLVLMGLSMLWP